MCRASAFTKPPSCAVGVSRASLLRHRFKTLLSAVCCRRRKTLRLYVYVERKLLLRTLLSSLLPAGALPRGCASLSRARPGAAQGAGAVGPRAADRSCEHAVQLGLEAAAAQALLGRRYHGQRRRRTVGQPQRAPAPRTWPRVICADGRGGLPIPCACALVEGVARAHLRIGRKHMRCSRQCTCPHRAWRCV